MREKRLIGILLTAILTLVVSGCEVEPTPLPPDAFIVSESTPTPDAFVPGDRYAITQSLASLYPAWTTIYPDTTQIIEPDLVNVTDYDLIVGAGAVPQGAQQATGLTVGMIAVATLPPLDDPILRELIVQSPIPASIVDEAWAITPISRATLPPTEIRERLANSGSPDGISLTIAVPEDFPMEAIEQQFAENSIRLIVSRYFGESPSDLVRDARTHLVMAAWHDGDLPGLQTAAGDENIIPFFTVPIYYFVNPDRSAVLNGSGMPVLSG